MLAFLTLALTLQADCPDCGPVRDVDPPVVALRVLAPQKGNATGTLTYQVVLTNRATAKAFDVKVKLDLPDKTTLVSSSVNPDKQQNTLVWNIGTMPGECQRRFDVTLKTTSEGPIDACFRVSYEHGVCVTTTAACKPSGKDEEKLPPPKVAGQLSVQKIAPARQGMGTPILYSITVTNTGRIPVQAVELEDLFPANAVYVQGSADNNGQLQGPESKKMQWRLGTMLPQETRTVTFKVRPMQVGTFLNVASAHGIDGDGQRVQSPDSTATTDVSGMATIYMEVKDTVDPLFLGGSTMYTVLVRNTGTAPATSIRLLAEIPQGMSVSRIGPSQEADASGYRSGEQRVQFASFNLQPKAEKVFTIEVKAERAALFRFRTTLTADMLDPTKPPLMEEETTTVVNERPPDSQTRLDVKPLDQLAKK
ncbi:MAG: hypothetical protein U0796_22255 [Gemmatales bacterium]